MTAATTQPTPATGLDSLASQAQQALAPPIGQGTTDLDAAGPGAQPVDPQQAEAIKRMQASMQHLAFGLLKLARNILAKRLPEIREEWPDELLQEPSAAAVPVLQKRLGKIMEVAASDPYTAVLVVSLIPLGMGLFNAWERAQARLQEDTAPKPGTSQDTLDGPGGG